MHSVILFVAMELLLLVQTNFNFMNDIYLRLAIFLKHQMERKINVRFDLLKKVIIDNELIHEYANM